MSSDDSGEDSSTDSFCKRRHPGFKDGQSVTDLVDPSDVLAVIGDFQIFADQSDDGGGSGDVIISLELECPERKCARKISVQVCVSLSFTVSGNSRTIESVEEIHEATVVDKSTPSSQGRLERSDQQEQDKQEWIREHFQLFLEQDRSTSKDARRRWRTLKNATLSAYRSVRVMYHNANPAARAAITSSGRLRATAATDPYYDRELTRADAPQVVFHQLNVRDGRPLPSSRYPLGYKGSESIPRYDVDLTAALRPNGDYYWLFIGFAFPYARVGRPAGKPTVQVHVAVVKKNDPRAEWCLKHLHLLTPSENHLLLRLSADGRMSVLAGSPAASFGSVSGAHDVYLNVAHVGNVEFANEKIAIGHSIHWNAGAGAAAADSTPRQFFTRTNEQDDFSTEAIPKLAGAAAASSSSSSSSAASPAAASQKGDKRVQKKQMTDDSSSSSDIDSDQLQSTSARPPRKAHKKGSKKKNK